MKKIVLTLALALAVTAYADTRQIDYLAWAFDHNATDLSDDSGNTGILQNYDVLWQLIYTPGSSSLAPNLENTDDFLAEGESLLGSRLLTGSSHGVWQINLLPDWDSYDNPTATFSPDSTATAYNVYQRIYELEPGTTAPVAGTYYYDSELIDLTKEAEWNSDLPFAVYAVGDDEMTKGIQPTLQVQGPSSVPEPATMSLLGLGALAMVLRRKLRK